MPSAGTPWGRGTLVKWIGKAFKGSILKMSRERWFRGPAIGMEGSQCLLLYNTFFNPHERVVAGSQQWVVLDTDV